MNLVDKPVATLDHGLELVQLSLFQYEVQAAPGV